MVRKASPAKPKRVRRSPAEARQLILEAAVRTLSQRGPAAIGLKEVAAEAGVSHALVAHYFGTYEALVEAAVGETLRTVRERLLKRMMSEPNPTPDRIAQLYFDIALEPWYGRLISWSFFHDPGAASEHVKALVPDMKLMAAATEYIFNTAPNARTKVTSEQAEALLVSLWATVVGYVAGQQFFWAALGKTPSPARDLAVREVIGALARSPLFGLSESPPEPKPKSRAPGRTARKASRGTRR